MREFSRRSWLIICAVGAFGAAAGLLTGLGRQPTYTSAATISSARLNVLTEALPSYVEAATNLASTYSRMTMTDAVEGQVANQLGIPLQTVRSAVAATPVPDDPVLRIIATGRSPTEAQQIASATARSLVTYVRGLVTRPTAGPQIMRAYSATTHRAQQLDALVGRLSGATSAEGTSRRETTVRQLSGTTLRLRALAASYISYAQDATSGATPQILTASSSATNDRPSGLERYLIIGTIVGAVIGLLVERGMTIRGGIRTRKPQAV